MPKHAICPECDEPQMWLSVRFGWHCQVCGYVEPMDPEDD